ncbi:hypothetical protein [Nonomuraea jabiensis]|uniref:hypothetical protein n=1 Tax=Nonomuraea jabiensis TaxID=882448 RepID=UPI003D72598D
MQAELKTFTVTVSGSEREDGEAPYTWVVNAKTPWQAMNKAKDIHHTDAQEEYEEMQVEEIFEGLPSENCGYHWNDCRDR